jgi:dihydropyrimidinase
VIDYSFHGVIQHVDDDVLTKMAALKEEGIVSFKLYTTYGFKLSNKEIYSVLERAAELKVLITAHCEDDETVSSLIKKFRNEGNLSPRYHSFSRPPEAEAEAVKHIINLAKMAGDAPLYIVHLTNAPALEIVKNARASGQKNLFIETCPQYLFLDKNLYNLPDGEGVKYIMCPPLRGEADREALWRGLVSDIDTVATDHCPFFYESQKIAGIHDFTKCPSGTPGIEERIPLMYSEGVAKKRLQVNGSSLRRFTEICSTNPAKIFGLYPQKGVIKEGSDADLVIIDPSKREVLSRKKLHANVDYSAYEGIEVQGLPVCTISRGEIIIRDGNVLAQPGRGKFIKRQAATWSKL